MNDTDSGHSPISVKSTFHFNDRPGGEHLFFVASNTTHTEIVIMNLTTERRWTDSSCIIEAGEHEFVMHRSCVAYDRAMLYPTDQLIADINDGTATPRAPLSNELMLRIWDGASRTRNLPLKCLSVLRAQDLIP